MRQQSSHSVAPSAVDGDDRVVHIKGTRLTKREQEIVAALMRGCANKEIARELGVSYQTVKNQLTTLFRKLGVAGRLELVTSAWRDRRP
jgi:DNA-binding NarL/FixJ family response regulator